MPFKYYFIFLFFYWGCSQGAPQKASQEKVQVSNSANNAPFNKVVDTIALNTNTIIIESINEVEYNELKKNSPPQIVQKDSLIRKENNIIKLPVINGKDIVLEDIIKVSELESKRFIYMGQFLARFYLIVASQYENSDMLIIDRNNGKIIKAWAYPYLSPNKSSMLVYSNNYDYEILPNGLQLFRINNNELKLEWEWTIKDWKPLEVIWLDDKRILVKKVEVFNSKTIPDKVGYLLLKIGL